MEISMLYVNTVGLVKQSLERQTKQVDSETGSVSKCINYYCFFFITLFIGSVDSLVCSVYLFKNPVPQFT